MSRQSWLGQEFSVVTEYFDVAIELAKVRRNYVATRQFYVMTNHSVATKLARIGRIYVATEDFWVTTELAKPRVFYCDKIF